MTADPERSLALSYAPPAQRAGVSALFALDDALAAILRTTSEPMIGQMRLTWWHEALNRLDSGIVPAEPVLAALAAEAIPHGISGARLANMIDAWEVLLDPDLPDDATLEHYAARGVILFGAAGSLLGTPPSDPVAPAGRGWALADLARHVQDGDVARRALGLAQGPLTAATMARWSRAGRPLGALAHLARLDLAAPLSEPIARGAPRRVWRILIHRLSGR
ncbi:squalene/phytoene synthase family protein [Sphingomonas sp.]|uniref:squalene/phytoene synthase family protein n=1 Tax=Sphingomonas sp. TaxID=28214 RepID=UPI003D6D9142